ncbi:BadM/Rrf2 family transcriptional regulator (plasmid) [Sphingomonas sp. MM-1]|uniref:Rrf2 family transcriptional regulator n=1 Tax=Sphingomonas sp. MM-1 TaxID=745310 RepID=UPI0002C05B7A|nr:Rrf2 family transcriptional regulator [Sphingomonas sp. MM-1]AGH51709.1 BadM/Rrf2 family transcriptional regulator [Sphingomonas sp. MM-1]
MKLTLFTDYSMRVLLYLGARPDRLCSIGEVAQAYGISQNHLMKVVNQLARSGDVESVRGRSGGIRLGRPPEEINIGALIRQTEDGFDLVDCGGCVVAPVNRRAKLTPYRRPTLTPFFVSSGGYPGSP